MSDYTLTYCKDKSQEINIETINDEGTKSLYFEQEYKEARKMINDIIESQKREPTDKTNGYNNRILFIGQRGCGKTSVMRSIASYLVETKKEVKLINNAGNFVKTEFLFDCLPMVDPGHFDNNNNILLTVITSMFSVTKKKMLEVKDDNEDVSGRREELLKQFDNVFKSLESIKSELQTYTLETLNRKSGAEDMRGKMNKLVQNYLDLLNEIRGTDPRYSKLVLMIDDIDMSVSYASEMLEQIYKYLGLDNLIILISANLNQLNNEMREHYSKGFPNTLNNKDEAQLAEIEDQATKHLLKVFPTSRRVNVERRVNQLLKTRLIIEKCGKDGDLQKVILSLIWWKTRLLFVPKDPDAILHPIIPTNLRDLGQFLDMLTILPEVSYEGDKLFKDEKAYDTCNKNLQVFKQYVMRTWIPNHLSVDEELVFKNIPSDITEINKHLINSINVIGTKHKNRLMSREVSLDMIERNAENINIDRDIYTMVSPNDPRFVKANKISDIFNQPSNYSYGDLLLMIDKYETYFESEDDRKFTDAIKIYYSILLFETMFFDSTKVEYDFNNYKKLPDEQKVIPIQKLIGGTVYYPNYFEIITEKHFNQKGPSFDAKRAFYHTVEVKEKENEKVGDGYPFFAVLYYGDIRPDRYDKKHIYDTTFENDADVDGKKYVTFDMLSILNNMLNPCHTIGRLDDDNYKNESYKELVNYVKEWGKENQIAEKSIPNAILPFYAVDLMLNYLGHSYTAKRIINEEEYNKVINEVESVEGLLKNYCVFYTEEFKKTDEQSKVKEYDEIKNLKNNLDPGSLFKDSSPDQENTDFGDGEKKDKIENHIQILKTYFDVIKYAFGFVKKSIADEDNVTVEWFRDKILFKVLALKAMPKRERDSLIKDLHKCKSVADIYKLLVDVLWKDAIMENVIRFKIQKEVRKNASVENYYNKLWKKTEELLMAEDIKVDVYRNIYNNAVEKFVRETEKATKSKTTKKTTKSKATKSK